MPFIYVNFPNSRITVHLSQDCSSVNENGRRVRNVATYMDQTQLIHDIGSRALHFRAVAGENDLWVNVHNNDTLLLAEEIAAALNGVYNHLPAFPVRVHCHGVD